MPRPENRMLAGNAITMEYELSERECLVIIEALNAYAGELDRERLDLTPEELEKYNTIGEILYEMQFTVNALISARIAKGFNALSM